MFEVIPVCECVREVRVIYVISERCAHDMMAKEGLATSVGLIN